MVQGMFMLEYTDAFRRVVAAASSGTNSGFIPLADPNGA